MPLPKPIPKPLFQGIALVLLLVTFAITAYWAVTYSGPWAALAEATKADDGTYAVEIVALGSWLVPFGGWLVVIVPLRLLTPFPPMKERLATLDGGLFRGLAPSGAKADARLDPTMASAGRRVGAFLIDRTLVVVVLLVGIMPAMLFDAREWTPPRIVAFVVAMATLVVVVLYAWVRDAVGGASIGRRLLGIRVVDAQTRKPIGAWRSFKREVPLHVSPLPFIELALLFASKDRRRLGDRWANTIVVRTRLPSGRSDAMIVGADPP